MFQRGDIKYLILDLLKGKNRHGYEIIRELEERSFGFYSPKSWDSISHASMVGGNGICKFCRTGGEKNLYDYR